MKRSLHEYELSPPPESLLSHSSTVVKWDKSPNTAAATWNDYFCKVVLFEIDSIKKNENLATCF